MSTDHEFRPSDHLDHLSKMSKRRRPCINVQVLLHQRSTSSVVLLDNNNINVNKEYQEAEASGGAGGGTAAAIDDHELVVNKDVAVDECCRTPKSDEHKIPVILRCPPAPRKKRPVVSCKRKLLDLFEVKISHEQVDPFFEQSNLVIKKPQRQRPCISSSELMKY